MSRDQIYRLSAWPLTLALLLAACAPVVQTQLPTEISAASPAATLPEVAPTDTQPPATTVPIPTAAPTETQEPPALSLTNPGPYFVGNRSYTIVDDSRDGRKINVTIYYPALQEKDANGHVVRHKAAADLSSAPYPLILTGPNSGDYLLQTHLASHGLVTAIVRFPDLEYSDGWGFGIIDHPCDMTFALEQLASNPPDGLEGVVNTDQAGAAGYSWDGFFSLVLGGVRIDPQHYLAWCNQASSQQPPLEEWYLEYTCALAANWDALSAHVGNDITTSDDGLWQPVTDERIRAVMPMAADGAWLYGEGGLAAVDRPVLMIQATEDSQYQPAEAAFIYENLGTQAKSMISFIGKDHMMVMDPEQANRMRHFATAFFGYYLQGREDYLELFSQDFVSQFADLAWGIYTGE